MLDIKKFISYENDDLYETEIMADRNDLDVQRVLASNTISSQLNGLNRIEGFIQEFGDIDYATVKMSLGFWSTESLLQLPVTKFGRPYFDRRIANAEDTSFDEWLNDLFTVIPGSEPDKARKYWKEHGTWKTPIIIIKSEDFPEADLQGPYQLYEGHTRLAWLNILDKYKSVPLKENHLVWVIKHK